MARRKSRRAETVKQRRVREGRECVLLGGSVYRRIRILGFVRARPRERNADERFDHIKEHFKKGFNVVVDDDDSISRAGGYMSSSRQA